MSDISDQCVYRSSHSKVVHMYIIIREYSTVLLLRACLAAGAACGGGAGVWQAEEDSPCASCDAGRDIAGASQAEV